MLATILLVIHLVIAVAIIVLVLLQQGKGADMGAAFGGGSSQTLFGARGSANFLSRLTSGLVAGFFLTSLSLAYIYNQQSQTSKSVVESAIPEAPAPAGQPADNLPQVPQDTPATGAGGVERPEVPVDPAGDGGTAGGDVPAPPE